MHNNITINTYYKCIISSIGYIIIHILLLIIFYYNIKRCLHNLLDNVHSLCAKRANVLINRMFTSRPATAGNATRRNNNTVPRAFVCGCEWLHFSNCRRWRNHWSKPTDGRARLFFLRSLGLSGPRKRVTNRDWCVYECVMDPFFNLLVNDVFGVVSKVETVNHTSVCSNSEMYPFNRRVWVFSLFPNRVIYSNTRRIKLI